MLWVTNLHNLRCSSGFGGLACTHAVSFAGEIAQFGAQTGGSCRSEHASDVLAHHKLVGEEDFFNVRENAASSASRGKLQTFLAGDDVHVFSESDEIDSDNV